MNPKKCRVEGCTNKARNKGNGRVGTLCSTHHSKKNARRNRPATEMCNICMWAKGRCDKHRIVWGCNGGKYEQGNVITLCPNCHRLVHTGRLVLK